MEILRSTKKFELKLKNVNSSFGLFKLQQWSSFEHSDGQLVFPPDGRSVGRTVERSVGRSVGQSEATPINDP